MFFVCGWDGVQEGPITVLATATGAHCSVSAITAMVEEAQGREAPVQRLADAIAGPFCLTIMALSAATFAFWYGRTLGVCIRHVPGVACSCSVGGYVQDDCGDGCVPLCALK